MTVRAGSRFMATAIMVSGLSLSLLIPLHGADEPQQPAEAALPKNFRVHDLDGRQFSLGASNDCRGVALIFLSTECPLSNGAIPKLNKLASSYGAEGVELYGVIADRSITRTAAKEHQKKYRVRFPMILDAAHSLRELTGATHTPQGFVFDRNGKEIYRGQLDDASERLGKKSAPKKHYLAEALKSAARGTKLAVSRTEPVGCLLEEPGEGGTDGELTFNRDVAPIVFSNCVACHRDGAVGPFPLTSYEEVSKRAKQIAQVVTERVMPPWKPAPDYGHFANERRLSKPQIALFRAWAEADVPEGNPDDLPPLPTFPKGWQLGKPDLIVKMTEPFRLYADGPDLYQHFVIPLGLSEDRVINAVEVHPGNAKIVHHAHMFIDNTGQARQLDEADPSYGYTRFGGHGITNAAYLGGWNPGATPHFFPQGTGRLMPKGGDAVFQIHYHPSGKPELDQTQIGVYFAPPEAQQLITDLIVGNVDLVIPAGNDNVRFNAEYTTPVSLLLMEIRPHLHLLGKSFQVRGLLPNGGEVPLIKIDDWDFNWQDSYVFDPIVRLPAGSKIQIQTAFDNSEKNRDNPHSPPKTVYFGEESTDEMSSCAIRVTTDTYPELQRVIADNGKYWTAEMKKYLDRNMTPDKKFREPVKKR